MAKANDKKSSSGKRTKAFVDHQSLALDLARSIGETQEEKTKQKVNKHQRPQQKESIDGAREDRRHRRPSGKEKLKEVKASILADRSRLKKEKAKHRRESRKVDLGTSTTIETQAQSEPGTSDDTQARRRKRVAFA